MYTIVYTIKCDKPLGFGQVEDASPTCLCSRVAQPSDFREVVLTVIVLHKFVRCLFSHVFSTHVKHIKNTVLFCGYGVGIHAYR